VLLADVDPPNGITSNIIDPVDCSPVDPDIRVLFGQVRADANLLQEWEDEDLALWLLVSARGGARTLTNSSTPSLGVTASEARAEAAPRPMSNAAEAMRIVRISIPFRGSIESTALGAPSIRGNPKCAGQPPAARSLDPTLSPVSGPYLA
jgi:hypothetical protein